MDIYLTIMVTILVITQVVRITQNTIQLHRQNILFKEQLSQLKDVTQEDFDKQKKAYCYACFYDDHYDRGVCAGCGYNNDNNWQWRGQKED